MNRSVSYDTPMPTVYGDTFYHIDEMVDSTVGAEIRRGKELQNRKKNLKKSRIGTNSISYNNDGSNSVKSINNRKSASYSQKITESIQRLARPLNRNYPDLAYNGNKVITPSQRMIEKRKSISQRSPPGFSLSEGQSFRNRPVKSQPKKNLVNISLENKKNIDNAHKKHRTRKKPQNEVATNEKEATYARSFCIMFAHRIAEELLPSYEVNLFGRLKYLSSVLKEEICIMTADERIPKKDKNLESLRKNLVDEIANRTAIWINVVMEEAFSKLAEDELRAEMNKLFSVPCLGNDIRSTKQPWHNSAYRLDLEAQEGPIFQSLDKLIDNVEEQLPTNKKMYPTEKLSWVAKENKTRNTKERKKKIDSIFDNSEMYHLEDTTHKEEQLPTNKKMYPTEKLSWVAKENKTRNTKERKKKIDSIFDNSEMYHLEDTTHEVSHTSLVKVPNVNDEFENVTHGDSFMMQNEAGFQVKDEKMEKANQPEDDVPEVSDNVVDSDSIETDSDVSLDSEGKFNNNMLVEYEEKIENQDLGSRSDDVVNLTELIDGIVGAGNEAILDEDTTKDNVIKFIDDVMNNLDDDVSRVQSEISSEDITFGINSDLNFKQEVKESAWYGDMIETWRAEILNKASQEINEDILDVGSQYSKANLNAVPVKIDSHKTYNSETALEMKDTVSALRQLKTVAIEQQDYVEISDSELNKITNFSEVANAINQISSIHETIAVEPNVQGALEEKVLKLIDEWCPESMDETMGQTISYVSGEVASWLVGKHQLEGKINEELPHENFVQNLTSSMHSINSETSMQTGVSDESNNDRGFSLVEDIQIPFRDSTPSTEEIRVFQSSHFKSSSSVINDFRDSDSMSSMSSIVTLKLDVSVTSALTDLPIEQDLLAEEITRNITEEISRRKDNENHEKNMIENKEDLLTLLSSQISSCSSTNYRMEASNHGDTREFSLNQDTTSDDSNDESNYNRDILAHILPDIFGVSEYENGHSEVFEENNYKNYRVPHDVSGSAFYTAKVECDPCYCDDDQIAMERRNTSKNSSIYDFPPTLCVIIKDWGQVLQMFSLDMLSWSQYITSISIEAREEPSHEDTIFHKPLDYFNVKNKHDWMKFRELVEEEAARRRKHQQIADNDKCCSSKLPLPPPEITYTKQNSFPKPMTTLKCNTQGTVNINRNDDKCNQWIHGKVLEHLLENKSKTTMDDKDWKELRRSLKRDEQKWSVYRKRADRKF